MPLLEMTQTSKKLRKNIETMQSKQYATKKQAKQTNLDVLYMFNNGYI